MFVFSALLLHNPLSCVYILFGSIPVNKLYPQHSWDLGAGSQQMDLLVAEPELCGVIWGEVTEALLVLDPVFLEVHAAVTSL